MTFTRLSLGEPRLRGKVKGPVVAEPCTEDLVYDANILTDPGFETAPSNPNGEPGEDFPIAAGSAYWDDGSFASQVGDTVHWGTNNGNFPDIGGQTGIEQLPHLDTSDPHSGSDHVIAIGENGNLQPNGLVPVFQLCSLTDGSGNPRIASARIGPGDFIEASAWMFVAAGGESVFWDIFIEFFNASWTGVGNANASGTLTNAYVQYSADAIAPANAHYALVTYGWTLDTFGSNTTSVYIDDCALEIA
jgi:hypothetical protein